MSWAGDVACLVECLTLMHEMWGWSLAAYKLDLLVHIHDLSTLGIEMAFQEFEDILGILGSSRPFETLVSK